jgi:hypothetical protein
VASPILDGICYQAEKIHRAEEILKAPGMIRLLTRGWIGLIRALARHPSSLSPCLEMWCASIEGIGLCQPKVAPISSYGRAEVVQIAKEFPDLLDICVGATSTWDLAAQGIPLYRFTIAQTSLWFTSTVHSTLTDDHMVALVELGAFDSVLHVLHAIATFKKGYPTHWLVKCCFHCILILQEMLATCWKLKLGGWISKFSHSSLLADIRRVLHRMSGADLGTTFMVEFYEALDFPGETSAIWLTLARSARDNGSYFVWA